MTLSSAWSDTDLHFVKRKLSVYEKSSLWSISPADYALIMPGLPSEEGACEVDELEKVGFVRRNIVAVEKDEVVAEALWDQYMDTLQVHMLPVEEFLALAKMTYSYIHLDFCGQLSEEILYSLSHLPRLLAPVARVRLSTLRSRRMNRQLRFEEMYHRTLLKSLCRQAELEHLYDPGETPDTTQVLAAAMLIELCMGMPIGQYADYASATDQLPEPQGKFLITKLDRGFYYDSSSSSMTTVWLDIVPAPAPIGFFHGYVQEFIKELCQPLVSFNNPIFYDDAQESSEENGSNGQGNSTY